MTSIHLEKFLEDFFSAYQCQIKNSEQGVIEVELTEELDKALINRPFYWHYMKSLGEKGQPMTLTLITNREKKDVEGERMDLGSPRLQQIFQYVTDQEKYTCLFQQVDTQEHTPLYPWLLANIKISYQGSLLKEELISLGIQLITGKVVVNMMDELKTLSLKNQISSFCYMLSPIITLPSGYKRLEKIILDYVERQPKEWATKARKRLEEETSLLEHFYQDDLENDLLKKEVEELSKRYTPKITLEVVNGGLIYLLKNVETN